MEQRPQKNTAFIFVCILMLLLALPMVLWCFRWIRIPDAFFDPEYGGPPNPLISLGAALGILSYLYSMVMAGLGLFLASRRRRKACTGLAAVLCLLLILTAICQRSVYLLTMLPLTVCGVLFLIGALRMHGSA